MRMVGRTIPEEGVAMEHVRVFACVCVCMLACVHVSICVDTCVLSQIRGRPLWCVCTSLVGITWL